MLDKHRIKSPLGCPVSRSLSWAALAWCRVLPLVETRTCVSLSPQPQRCVQSPLWPQPSQLAVDAPPQGRLPQARLPAETVIFWGQHPAGGWSCLESSLDPALDARGQLLAKVLSSCFMFHVKRSSVCMGCRAPTISSLALKEEGGHVYCRLLPLRNYDESIGRGLTCL